MSSDQPDFEVLTVGELRRRYKLEGIKAEPVDFDESEVPEVLRPLIPLAHIWGVGDDLLREDMIRAADPEALQALKRAVMALDDELQDWLTSPEALATISPAHVAFSTLGMVADEIR